MDDIKRPDKISAEPVMPQAPTQPTPEPLVQTPQPAKKKSPLIWVLLIVILIAGGAAGFLFYKSKHKKAAAPTTAAQSFTGPVENITIGNVGQFSIFNLIAKDQGYFDKHGLNATIVEYPSGPPAVKALIAKKADFAVAADFVGVNNIFDNPNVRILSQVSQQDNFSILARKDKGITNPKDLKGKKIAVTKKSAGEFFLGRYLSLQGLKLADVTEVDLQPDSIEAQLKNGQVDAVVTFEPHIFNLKKDMGDKLVEWSAQGDLKTQALLYTTSEYIQQKPEVIKRYLAALVDAEKYLKNNQQGSKDILVKSQKVTPEFVASIWPNIHYSLTLDQTLLLEMEDEAKFAIDNNITTQTKVPNYLNYIYFDGLKAVKPEAITIVQ